MEEEVAEYESKCETLPVGVPLLGVRSDYGLPEIAECVALIRILDSWGLLSRNAGHRN